MEFRTSHLDALMDIVPGPYVAFLKKLMEPDPNARYQSAGDALRDLGEQDEEPANDLRGNRQKLLIPVVLVIGMAAVGGIAYLVSSGPGRVGPASDASHAQIVAQDSRDSLAAGTNPSDRLTKKDDKTGRPVAEKEKDSSKGGRSGFIGEPVRDSAQVHFTSNPWAKVYVDGRLIGETPLAQPVSLAKGKHSVTFSNPSFEPIIKSISVQSGPGQVVTGDFLENAGFLVCSVKPWAEVFVDEQYKDTTPLNRPIILTAGTHRIRLHNSAFRDTIQVITIRPKDTVAVSVTLRSFQ